MRLTEFFKPLLTLSKNRQHQIAGCKLNHTGYFLPASFGTSSPVAWQTPLLIRSLLILPEFYIRLWEVWTKAIPLPKMFLICINKHITFLHLPSCTETFYLFAAPNYTKVNSLTKGMMLERAYPQHPGLHLSATFSECWYKEPCWA